MTFHPTVAPKEVNSGASRTDLLAIGSLLNNDSKLTGVTAIHLKSSPAKSNVGCPGHYGSKVPVDR